MNAVAGILAQIAKNGPSLVYEGSVVRIANQNCSRSTGTPGKRFPRANLALLIQLQQSLLAKYRIQSKLLFHAEESVVRDDADNRLTVPDSVGRCPDLSDQRINLFEHRKSARAIRSTSCCSVSRPEK